MIRDLWNDERGSVGFWVMGTSAMVTLALLFLTSLEMVRLVLVRRTLEQSLMAALRTAAREFAFSGAVRDPEEPLVLDPDRAPSVFARTLAANLDLAAPPGLTVASERSVQFALSPGGILPEGATVTVDWGVPEPTALRATLTAPVELPSLRIRTTMRVSARSWLHVSEAALR